MSKQLKLRRGTTAQHSTFTGAEGEVTVDTTKDTLVVHDGVTAGGKPLATEAGLAGKQPLSNNLTTYASTGIGFRNRIINGDMRIDQRNNGASVSVATGVFGYLTVDRWRVNNPTDGALTLQRSSVAPAGFNNSLLATITTADASLGAAQFCFLQQPIEGFNVGDLAFGSASASAVTLSFWVRSSVTGTMGGSITNGVANRSYPFTYTVNSANTWEQKTVTLSGDTTGTWATDNSAGMNVFFSLGCGTDNSGTAGSWTSGLKLSATGATSVVGTSGATFYITGVQLEAGTVATPFERRDYGRELMMCQRYYEVVGNGASGTLNSGNAGTVSFTTFWKVTKRAGPTVGVGFGAVQGADIASAVTYQGGIGAGAWYFPQGVTASAEL